MATYLRGGPSSGARGVLVASWWHPGGTLEDVDLVDLVLVEPGRHWISMATYLQGGSRSGARGSWWHPGKHSTYLVEVGPGGSWWILDLVGVGPGVPGMRMHGNGFRVAYLGRWLLLLLLLGVLLHRAHGAE
jgi:hypothetical protein